MDGTQAKAVSVGSGEVVVSFDDNSIPCIKVLDGNRIVVLSGVMTSDIAELIELLMDFKDAAKKYSAIEN